MSILSRTAPSRNPGRTRAGASPAPLRFVTFLAPNLFPLYEFITRHVGARLGLATELAVGSSYEELTTDELDVAFVCGLPYVELARDGQPAVEPLAAPVLQGERYGGKPVYFSDVIVRRESPFRSFADLRGCSWAYNEPHSQSGYGITRYHLVRGGETRGYFGRVVEAGWHERAIRLVAAGVVDASAIDSHVLAITLRDHPELADRLRVIETLGPSTIQPIVGSRRLSEGLRADLRAALIGLTDDTIARPHLDRALIEGFEPVDDSDYKDLRQMLVAVEAAGFLTLC